MNKKSQRDKIDFLNVPQFNSSIKQITYYFNFNYHVQYLQVFSIFTLRFRTFIDIIYKIL